MDHGYEVDTDKRCAARTKKETQCRMPPLRGITLCALHSGLARAKGKPGYGDPRALDAYKRSRGSRTHA
jgi:hypothetical protein